MATIGQRIRAAQVQAGIASVDELAEQPGRPDKFGAKTIGRVIRGDRTLQPHEAEWLAKTLSVDAAYFFNDPQATGSLDGRVLELLGRVEKLLEKQNDLLNRQSGILERIEDAIAAEDDSARRLATDGDAWADAVIARIQAQQPAPQSPVRVPKGRAKSGSRKG